MDKIPDSSNMIGEFFRKGKSFSDETRYSLSHRIVKSFSIGSFATFLDYLLLSLFWKNSLISTPKVGKKTSTLTLELPVENPTILEILNAD